VYGKGRTRRPWSRERIETTVLRWLHVAGLASLVVVVGFPFYWMVLSSLKPLQEILLKPASLWPDPSRLRWDAYVEVLTEHGFIRYIVNSLYVALATAAIAVSLASIGAYAATRLTFQGKKAMSAGILAIYMLPAIVLVIPLYVLLSRLGLRDSLHVLIPVYLAQTLPVALYMLRSHFLSLPPSLEQAGMVDGCTRWGVIWRIVLPLSTPTLASAALYTFMIAWNEFLFAFMFLDTPEKFTLTRGVVQLAGSVHLSKQLVMAASVLVSVPVIILFLALERYLVRGLTAGAVKG